MAVILKPIFYATFAMTFIAHYAILVATGIPYWRKSNWQVCCQMFFFDLREVKYAKSSLNGIQGLIYCRCRKMRGKRHAFKRIFIKKDQSKFALNRGSDIGITLFLRAFK